MLFRSDTKPESSQVIMNILADSSDSLSYFSKSNDFRNKLVLDSGATEHYTPNKDWLLSYKPVYNKYIIVVNRTKISIKGTDNIPVYINNTEVNIIGVNYVLDIKTTLISSNKLAKKGWQILFKDNKALISHEKTKLKLEANWIFNAYYINININYNILEPVVYKADLIINNNNNHINTDLDLYHKQLLYINKDYIIKTIDNVSGLKAINSKNELYNCDSCYFGKFSRIISRNLLSNNNKILTIININITGLFKVLGLKGERYFIIITYKASYVI